MRCRRRRANEDSRPRDRGSPEPQPRHRLGDSPRRNRRGHPPRLCRVPARRAGPHRRPLPRPGAPLVPGTGRAGRASPVRQRQPVPEPGLRSCPALARPAPLPDPSLSAPDQRQGRALDPDGPVRVPVRRGLRLARRAAACARAVHRLLQRTAPASRYRRADTTSAADRAHGGLSVTNLARDYS